MDWLYEQLGMFAYSTELWSLRRKAGIGVKDFIEFMKDRADDVDLAMLRVLDDEAGGAGFKPWEPFDHPQLGAVEISGRGYTFSWQNPPGPLLEEVTSGNATFVIRAMGTAPRIVLKEPVVEQIGGDVFKITMVAQNTGFLPTNVSEHGKTSGVNKPVKSEPGFRDPVELVDGKSELDLGHPTGRVSQYQSMGNMVSEEITSRAIATWIVKSPRPIDVTVDVGATKAGRQSVTIRLDRKLNGHNHD